MPRRTLGSTPAVHTKKEAAFAEAADKSFNDFEYGMQNGASCQVLFKRLNDAADKTIRWSTHYAGLLNSKDPDFRERMNRQDSKLKRIANSYAPLYAACARPESRAVEAARESAVVDPAVVRFQHLDLKGGEPSPLGAVAAEHRRWLDEYLRSAQETLLNAKSPLHKDYCDRQIGLNPIMQAFSRITVADENQKAFKKLPEQTVKDIETTKRMVDRGLTQWGEECLVRMRRSAPDPDAPLIPQFVPGDNPMYPPPPNPREDDMPPEKRPADVKYNRSRLKPSEMPEKGPRDWYSWPQFKPGPDEGTRLIELDGASRRRRKRKS